MTSSVVNLSGVPFVVGNAKGKILACQTELSFWGGVEPATGEVIDRHHPLSGQLLQDKILILPGGRGSCSGSGVLLEMMVNGKGPAAIVISRPDDIITLGVWIAKEMFNISIPLLMLEEDDFITLSQQKNANIAGGHIQCSAELLTTELAIAIDDEPLHDEQQIVLNDYDRSLLNGEKSLAAQVAMKIILHMARLSGATTLTNVSQVHIDGCIYTGEASLSFAQKLLQMGGEFIVPTTLNAISVDYRRWQSQGVDSTFGEPASALADAYVNMGAKPTYTCAPYLLDSAPQQGEQIAWAESNAVVFANSVLGAKTMKYPDFLDACIALTGRAPLAGAHLNEHRRATLHINIRQVQEVDDLFYPLLGYHVGKIAGNHIPVLTGIVQLNPDMDNLRAFGAAFATVSSAPMFHIVGVTPDADTLNQAINSPQSIEKIELACADLYPSWAELNKDYGSKSDLISLGNPHFSLSEFEKLSMLCEGSHISSNMHMYITAGRSVLAEAKAAGYLSIIEHFGAKIITDTCWCMISEPVIPVSTQIICTNSAKYAHYGPGMTGRKFKLLSLEECVKEAMTGLPSTTLPRWLSY